MRRTADSKSADGGLTPSTPANLIGTSNPLSRSFIYRRIVHRHGRILRARGATPHLPLPFQARLRYNPLVHSSIGCQAVRPVISRHRLFLFTFIKPPERRNAHECQNHQG